jgi:hypothetical protein
MRYAIAKNNKEDYGLVVLSLLASEQEALRKMEFSTLNHEAFQTHMFNMESEFVPEALNMKVHYKTTHTAGDGGQGNFRKTFRTVRELWIWGDDTYPDMDIKRHLLAHLYIIGWQGGYLFPSHEELRNPPADGIYKTFITEEQLYRWVKNTMGNMFLINLFYAMFY